MIRRRFLIPALIASSLALTAAETPAPVAAPAPTAAPAPAASEVKKPELATDRPATPTLEYLVSLMDDAERSYYGQSFDYAMENTKPPEEHVWEAHASKGTINAKAPFYRNGTICRDFREKLTINGKYTVVSDGTGCKRVGSGGWCKLKKGDMATCAMEPPGNALEQLGRDVSESLDRKSASGRSWKYHWWPW